MRALILMAQTWQNGNRSKYSYKSVGDTDDLTSLIFIQMYALTEESRSTFFVAANVAGMQRLRTEKVQLCTIQKFKSGVRIPNVTRLLLIQQRKEILEALNEFFKNE